MSHPYAHAVGVLNTRAKNSDPAATLADLRTQWKKPLVLDHRSITYHNASKKERGDIKKALPYFVGGTLAGKRNDSNVASRTMLTLDVEAKAGQEVPPPPDKVFDALEALGAEGWVYTSLSHTPAAPRYRVVLPLGEHIAGKDLSEATLQASTQAAAKKLGLGPWCTDESWVLSQPMYLPAKLKDGVFWEGYTGQGMQWRTVRGGSTDTDGIVSKAKDIPDKADDPVLAALQAAGRYIGAAPRHAGMHYIKCPWDDAHSTESDSKTVYYEANYDGNARPACKCMSTSHDELTYPKLVRWLRDEGHLTKVAEDEKTSEVMDDYDTFLAKAGVGQYLDTVPDQREWAWDQFAPVGKVTVLAGPGGVSKSMMMLHLLVYGALGQSWAGFQVRQPLRGIYVSYEDDKLELHKRVHGLAQALREADGGVTDALYDINGSLQKNLLLYAADDEAFNWMLLRKPDQRSAAERTARVEWLIGFLKHSGMRVLVLDPAVYTHNLEESSPGDMALYMQTLTYIAKAAGVAVVVLHHMHKTASWATLEDINQGSLRGASSFADNSRSVGVMVSMPHKDAPRYGLTQTPDAGSPYAVFKHVKHNYSAPLKTQIFERRGPLLVPRPDLDVLTPTELDARSQMADSRKESLEIEGRSRSVVLWLLENEAASGTMIRLGLNIRHTMLKKSTEFLLQNGYIEVSAGVRNAVLYSSTPEGKTWALAADI